MPRQFQRSPLALAILTLLHEMPMHPYKMQRLIKERGKDQVINVEQRASLYQTIAQLIKAELITTWETERQEGFPERTVYRLTEKGHTTAVAWLREMVSSPEQNYPEFPAALSLLPLLTPDDAIQQMELRAARISERIAAIDRENSQTPDLPRLFLLEAEYQRQMLDTELTWVKSVIADLRGGQLTWTTDWAQPYQPPADE